MEMETRHREIARKRQIRKREMRKRQLRRRLAGGAVLLGAAGLAAFLGVQHLGNGDSRQQKGASAREDISASASASASAGTSDLAGEGMIFGSGLGVMDVQEEGTGLSGFFLLPEQFDLRTRGIPLSAPDQGTFSTCWAFASLKALETTGMSGTTGMSETTGTTGMSETTGMSGTAGLSDLSNLSGSAGMLETGELPELSADHMSLRNSFGLGQEAGGDYSIASAYLLAWQGPVAAADDPYGDGKTTEGLEPLCHVQEIRYPAADDPEQIKRYVYSSGGVQSSLYIPQTAGAERERYFHEEHTAYYYYGTEAANHDIVIVGWDDRYPKERFPQEPEADGAFLCMNTWGEDFGSSGLFYVSYEDSRILEDCVAYTRVEDSGNYDRLFQTDLCGWTGQLGYGAPEAWFANVYEAGEALELRAAGFYATAPDTSYRIYACPVKRGDCAGADGAADVVSVNAVLADRAAADVVTADAAGQPVAEGCVTDPGFYTIDFAQTVDVAAGESFAVIMWINSPGTTEPVAIEYRAGSRTSQVDIADGEGYISFDGISWERAETTQQCNLCLKVYADARGTDG